MKTAKLTKAVALSAALASAMQSRAADSSARSEATPVIVQVVADEADRTGEWSEAGTDVQAAITAAGEGGTVYFRAGVYRFTETLNLTAANQKLVGESRAETVLDGGGAVRILSTAGFAAPEISHFTFRNGAANDNGGAILLATGAGAFRVEDCDFLDNAAKNRGGAVFSYRNEGGIVTNCLFAGNAVTETVYGSSMGGGAYYAEHARGHADLYTTVSDCVFSNNCAKGETPFGGAVLFRNAGRLAGCLFVTNMAETVRGSSRGGSVYLNVAGQIADCTFMGYGKATYGQMAILGGASIVTNCQFRDVRGGSGCNGLVHLGGVSNAVVACTFTGIDAADYVMAEDARGTLVRNCLAVGNTGGAFVRGHNGASSTADATRIEHCTFAGNAAAVKAVNGTGSCSTNVFVNCVFGGKGPTANGVHHVVVTNSIVPVATGGSDDSGVIVTASPGLRSISRGDYRLKADSPGVDAGLDLGWQATGCDLAGDARLVGTAPDLGCYERQADETDPLYAVRAVPSEAEKTGDWADAHVGIQTAIDAAQDDDLVLVKDGTYRLAAPVRVSNRTLTVTGESRDGVVLDGQGASRCLEVEVSAVSSASPVFENLTLTNGFAGTDVSVGNRLGQGGAVWLSCVNAATRITLRNCRITGSRTEQVSGASDENAAGGGIYAANYCTLEGCLVDNNCASNAVGGGVRLAGVKASARGAGLFVTGCVISNNVSRGTGGSGGAGAHGGGAFVKSNAWIEKTLFVANAARPDAKSSYGGGLMTRNGTVTIANCRFESQEPANYGVALRLDSTALVSDCSFREGASGSYGTVVGGSAQSLFERCRFSSNQSPAYFTDGTSPLFRNCLFADGSDTAIRLFSGTSAFRAENCTFAGNKSALFVKKDFTAAAALVNCLVYGNTTDFVREDGVTSETTFALTNCLVSAYPNGHYTAQDCLAGVAPRFVSARRGDYSLKASSPCREKALSLDWMDADATDLAGNPRMLDLYGRPLAESPSALPDIGCFECPLKKLGVALIVR